MERLELGLCGRGFLDSVAKALAGAEGGLHGLEALLLGGAYSLLDSGLETLLASAPNLRELRLPQCCRLTGTGLACLPHCTPLLRSDIGTERSIFYQQISHTQKEHLNIDLAMGKFCSLKIWCLLLLPLCWRLLH